MKVYEVSPGHQLCPHTEKSLESVLAAVREWINEGDVGTVVSITVREMTEDEYDALPEWVGP